MLPGLVCDGLLFWSSSLRAAAPQTQRLILGLPPPRPSCWGCRCRAPRKSSGSDQSQEKQLKTPGGGSCPGRKSSETTSRLCSFHLLVTFILILCIHNECSVVNAESNMATRRSAEDWAPRQASEVLRNTSGVFRRVRFPPDSK